MLSFSGGKDSVLALHRLLENEDYDVSYLLITMSEDYERSSIHGVREEIVDAQAKAIGLPVKKVYLPNPCPNEKYEQIMSKVMEEAIQDGMTHVAFGDIFLEDLKKYREQNLEGLSIQPIFPLWGCATPELMNEFIDLGYKTIITTIDSVKVPESNLGKIIDHKFLNELPNSIDPCGENGEFHTFVYDGPIFNHPVNIKVTDDVVKDQFYWYRDLVLKP
ncbi:diphthine--ammonia ligase [Piscibacillus halophilus]|uniref:Dph6-related ATP pyrophosphatase n=1 Tax=Piscibacillus halophilus TaxID=571933 RepID=UPI002409F317|nr:diphthine--ammonia ligase [Piscibacillus halophilus]